jgi:hypothetical protein
MLIDAAGDMAYEPNVEPSLKLLNDAIASHDPRRRPPLVFQFRVSGQLAYQRAV